MSANLVFCADQRCAPHAAVLLYSILLKSSVPLDIYFISAGCSDAVKVQLNALTSLYTKLRNLEFKLEIIEADVDEFLDSSGLKASYFDKPSARLLKMFLPDILADKGLRQVLYLDADMLCRGDIAELTAAVENVTTLAGVSEPEGLVRDYKLLTAPYLNAGVLGLNLEYLSKAGFSEKCADFIKFNFKDLSDAPEQDVINNVLSALEVEPVLLPQRFNEIRTEDKAIKSALLLHYSGNLKPWEKQTRWRLKNIYWQAMCTSYVSLLRGMPMGPFMRGAVFQLYASLRGVINLYLSLKELIVGRKDPK